MIHFDDVVVRYAGAGTNAVDGITFEAASGVLTAVAGPNGSGKSTLVRALLGRQPLVRGRIRLGNADAAGLDRRDVARRVAVVTQREESTFPIGVRDFVLLGRYPHAGAWGMMTAADRGAADEALARAGVSFLADRRTDTLSGGEWQRVRIARALAQGGPALVLDEPTTFLDIAHEMLIFELLAALAAAGTAVLLVSHQLNLVARFAHTIVLLHEGRVAAAGAPAAVMQAPILERVYEWPLVVSRDPAVGAPTLVPLRSRTS
jgi:ABC-type cobalamin/Fe3+-siderophores transport system ATPase subunit